MPKYDPRKHHRRSIRLRGYDYSQPGAYFVTICTYQKECLLGDVRAGEMALSPYGRIVQRAWDDLPNHYPHVELDAWVIMPNHVHGIIVLGSDAAGACGVQVGLSPAPAAFPSSRRHGLSEIMRALKSFSARRINRLRRSPGTSFWQRGFYDHIIRHDREMDAIRQYIADNPLKWEFDQDNPSNISASQGR